MSKNGKGSKVGRRRGPRPGGRKVGRGAGRLVLAGRGDGWELWVPEDMPEDERAALVEGQAALLSGQSPAGPRRGRGNVDGALDQMTTARPVQLTLFRGTP